jgi:hypothetical protein
MFRKILAGMRGRTIAVVLFAMVLLMFLSGCASGSGQYVVERGPDGKRRITVTPGPFNPQTAKDHAAWAMYYTNHDDNAAAIASYTRAIDAATDTATRCRHLIQRGICRHNEYRHSQNPNAPQDIAGAEADFTEAVRLCPENTLGRHVRGMFYSNTGHPGKALEDLNFLVAREPGNPLFRHSRDEARRRIERIKSSREIVQSNTGHPDKGPKEREPWRKVRDGMRAPDYADRTAGQIVAAVPVTPALRQSVYEALTNMKAGSWILIHRGDMPIVNLIPVPQSGLLVWRRPSDAPEARYDAWNWRKGEPCPAQFAVLSQ